MIERIVQWLNDFSCNWRLPFHINEMQEYHYNLKDGQLDSVSAGDGWYELVIGYRHGRRHTFPAYAPIHRDA